MQKIDYTEKLINQILEEEKNINTMDLNDLKNLRNIIKKNNESTSHIVEKALVPLVKMYTMHINEPYWFVNQTKYEDNIWYIKLSKNPKIIDFSKILISKKLFLIDDFELLNTFKTWILIQGCPRYNNGLIQNNTTILQSVNKVLLLIDNIISNAEKINLIERKSYSFDSLFFKDILINIINKGAINATYNFIDKLEYFLKIRIEKIDIKDIIDFEKKYPLVKENYNITNLNFNLEQVRKSRYWLFINNKYKISKRLSILPSINLNDLDNNNYIHSDSITIKKITELSLFSGSNDTEYPLIPCRNYSENSSTYRTVNAYLEVIKKLTYVNTFDFCSQVNVKSILELSCSNISNHINLLEIGRYRSVPSKVILDAIQNGFEFIFKYMDSILESIFSSSCVASQHYKHGFKYNNWKSLKNVNWKSQIDHDLLKLGVKFWNIKSSDENRFELRRRNFGFCDLYNVLMGSIQIVIGAITARRQSELMDLNSINCLVPSNIDPSINKNIQFELIFDNRKSGIGGELNLRECLSRPIPNSIAIIIFKLQKFNERILKFNNDNSINLSLINYYSHHQNKFKKIYAQSYNIHLNAFCDYFQTLKVNFDSKDFKRYYIRQHQLRRFFVLLFFWSKSYDGLDTLRHFLGHTNPEHLYNYITESITGEVLSGVKAQALVEQISVMNQSKEFIKNIEYLNPVLEKYFGVREFEVLSESELFEIYGTDDAVRHIKNYSKVEQQITYLIDNYIISLEPEFFSIKNSEGKIVRDFNLILRIKDEI